MNWGNLYYYDPKTKVSLEDTIKVCAMQYWKKYQNKPTICELAKNLPEITEKIDGITVIKGVGIQNSHFWLGTE